jgi:hypothetical protein
MSLKRSVSLFILALISSVSAFSQDGPGGFEKTLLDIERKYTNVGNIGLTVTNFGTYGTRNANFPAQPSCRYPISSRIEHIYQGGLWVGAFVKNEFRVSTATTGGSRLATTISGYEFNAQLTDSMRELSSLTDERPSTATYSPYAISHQDFVCEYVDTFTRVPLTRDSIQNHHPLGIKVHQESYAYNFPFADFFVLLSYKLTNVGRDTLDSVYVGLWNNTVVRNTEYNDPRNTGTAYFSYGSHGFDSTQRMVYSFDPVGLPYGRTAIANSYVGIKLLGTTPFPSGIDSLGILSQKVHFNAWEFRQSQTDPWRASPTQDYSTSPMDSRYSRMTSSLDVAARNTLRTVPGNYIHLLTVGPLGGDSVVFDPSERHLSKGRLYPGDSVEVVFAVVCAKKSGLGDARNDTPEQRKELYAHVEWAELTYKGEDVNGNNVLEPSEDIARRDSVSPSEYGLRFEPDGKITRYLLPTPPRQPKVRVEVENQKVVVYWDKITAEESIDPVSGKKDFEGYRIYRSITGADFLHHNEFLTDIPLVGEFDRSDNNIGYNTGFSSIQLDTPKVFPGDTTQYWYRFPPAGQEVKFLNGWQYVFGVSAYDSGDAANGVPSLESAKSLRRVLPGTPPTSQDDVPIIVYPNPYYVNAYWDGTQERLRKIYFANLPALCEIRIYTLAGDVVATLEHDAATYDGSGINWFQQFGDARTPAQFAGGEHAWDLITKNDQAIATGLYLYSVEDKQTGKIKRGKFLIVK